MRGAGCTFTELKLRGDRAVAAGTREMRGLRIALAELARTCDRIDRDELAVVDAALPVGSLHRIGALPLD